MGYSMSKITYAELEKEVVIPLLDKYAGKDVVSRLRNLMGKEKAEPLLETNKKVMSEIEDFVESVINGAPQGQKLQNTLELPKNNWSDIRAFDFTYNLEKNLKEYIKEKFESRLDDLKSEKNAIQAAGIDYKEVKVTLGAPTRNYLKEKNPALKNRYMSQIKEALDTLIGNGRVSEDKKNPFMQGLTERGKEIEEIQSSMNGGKGGGGR
jgi:hypothetical protein